MSTRQNALIGLIGTLVLAGLCRADMPTVTNSNETNRIQSLNGTWKLATDPRNEGKKLKWSENPPENKSRAARVPGAIGEAFPDYHGVAWYWTVFRSKLHAKSGGTLAVRFREVDYHADVWLNGVFLGSHEGAEFPFELKCGDALRPHAENLLVVRVINPVEEPIDGFVLGDTAHRSKFNKNYGIGALYNYGGITRGVELIEIDPVRILDVHAQADMKENLIKVSTNLQNDSKAAVNGCMTVTVRLKNSDLVLSRQNLTFSAPSGESKRAVKITIAEPHYWSPEDPQFYLVTVGVECEAEGQVRQDQRTVHCGFRELRVDNGYFRLNGKRVLLRCLLAENDYLVGEKIMPEHLRRDLIFAKAAGFNTIRFFNGGVYPEQLDLCDEIGLMVYEESYASWYLSDPRLKSKFSDMSKMPQRFDRSMLGVVRRDRNHPSVIIWGMLNETFDGPVFRHVYNSLGKLRDLDDSRVVLLNSGRWDGIITVGSLSNPHSREWEPLWGKETAGGIPVAEVDAQGKTEIKFYQGGLGESVTMGFGDFHRYPRVPWKKWDRDFYKYHGGDAKPMFLSEVGTGSLLDVVNALYQCRAAGSAVETNYAMGLRKQAELLLADWKRLGMNEVYAFPEDLFVDSYRQQARQTRLELDLIRSNPKFCGYGITSMVDWNVGAGRWTYDRELKTGMLETLRDGWAPLRWCLFVEPGHVYAGREFELQAVLANEDRLKSGTYTAHFKLFGKPGVVWEKRVELSAPQAPTGADAPLTINVLHERVKLDVPPGDYEFAASLEGGGSVAGGRRKFYVSRSASASPPCEVTVLGLGEDMVRRLQSHSITCRPWNAADPATTETILVGNLSANAGFDLREWSGLMSKAARGCKVVFLSPLAFKRGDNSTGWLPLANKGRCHQFHDWVYHKECVAKAHPVFDGLQDKGVMDWEYYGQVIPQYLFMGQDTPDDVAAVAFATGYQDGTLGEIFRHGYACGLLFAGYRFGNGWFYLNTFPLLENLDANPTADRMLINIIRYAQKDLGKPLTPFPADFNTWMSKLYP
ncbi:MAG: beta galactosidase jelly roll domain-containing protein [Pirellulales bacterium]|nr:beta galactosidase jelly roll domain-containing protein [Pirellulales bacterium]